MNIPEWVPWVLGMIGLCYVLGIVYGFIAVMLSDLIDAIYRWWFWRRYK